MKTIYWLNEDGATNLGSDRYLTDIANQIKKENKHDYIAPVLAERTNCTITNTVKSGERNKKPDWADEKYTVTEISTSSGNRFCVTETQCDIVVIDCDIRKLFGFIETRSEYVKKHSGIDFDLGPYRLRC